MPDRVREAIFNLLRGHVEGQAVVDIFAGAGALGLEAISRGASRCVFVERDKRVVESLRSNIRALRVGDRCDVIQADALASSTPARLPRPAHLIFFDPPYRLMSARASRRRALSQLNQLVSLLDDDGFAVLRTPWPMPDSPGDKSARDELVLDDAEGPETHVYRRTAVHLYAPMHEGRPSLRSDSAS